LNPASSSAGVTAWSCRRAAQVSVLEQVISGQWHFSSRSDYFVPHVGEAEIRPIDNSRSSLGDSSVSGFKVDQIVVVYGNAFFFLRVELGLQLS
jgi:hypothetical protein